MREQIDDHLTGIEGKQRNIKNDVGQTRDQFENMNKWQEASFEWSDLLDKKTGDAEQKARDLAAQWKNVGEQIKNARKQLTKDIEAINLIPLGEEYTEADRSKAIKAAQEAYNQKYASIMADAKNDITSGFTVDENAFAGGLMKKYSMGGGVFGSGSRDSISAMLAPGEFIVRRAMVDKYGIPMLNAINQGSFAMPRYNMGQAVGNVGVKSENNTSIVAPMYNNYSVNVSVSNSNASADEIANRTVMKIKQMNDMQIRSGRGY